MAHLTLEQRHKIEAYRNMGISISEIAQFVGKDKSVISREIKRNSDQRSGCYKALLADKKSMNRHKTKLKKHALTAEVEASIVFYITKDYSPEQIVGRAKIDKIAMVSTERIYQYIWEDKRRGGVLFKHLRSKGKKYKKRGHLKDKRGQIVGRVDICERPAIVEKQIGRFGNRFGHRERPQRSIANH